MDYSGEARNDFFEKTDEEPADSYLVNYAVGHAPLPVHIGAWGNNESTSPPPKMKIDYIRIFQPGDRYSDMEPIYG